MLYAGTTSLSSFKYSINGLIFNGLNDIVKKLKQRSKSAGNILLLKNILKSISNGTSETLRNEIVVNLEHVKSISKHVPKHLKPLNDEQLGHYLAGLIDGDGHFSNIPQLVIVFSSPDAFLAYFLKEKLVYANVRKVKNKNAYLLVVSSKKGILKVLNLINGKLRLEHRFNQVINNIINNDKYKDINLCGAFQMNNTNDFSNHWLAGFTDADGSFQIKVINRITRSRPEIRLNYQIDQKKAYILEMIKSFIGGNVGYRKSQDTYYYGSTSFGSAKNVIQYFDKYHLQSSKHISYLRWRKVYLLIMDNEHLNEKGLSKILIIKSIINKHEIHTI